MRGFFTGSREYGVPRSDSDFDIVVLGNRRDLERWFAMQNRFSFQDDSLTATTEGAVYPSYNIRVGNLNVIFCLTRWQYFKWWLAMKVCKFLGPLDRDECVRVHKKII